MADDGLGLEAGEVDGLIGKGTEYLEQAAWLMGGGDNKGCSIGVSHCGGWIKDEEASDVILTVLDVPLENWHIIQLGGGFTSDGC